MYLLNDPIHILKKRWRILFVSGFFVAFVAGVVSLAFPLEYRADAQVLIVSKSRYGIDPYTAAKSAERVGENIVQVMASDDFYKKVMTDAPKEVPADYFAGARNERERRKRWERSVGASVVYGTGVLNVSAFSETKEGAVALSGAVADALVNKVTDYVGGDVSLKIINQPVPTNIPVRPNIPVNIAVGFFLGALLSAAVVVRRYR